VIFSIPPTAHRQNTTARQKDCIAMSIGKQRIFIDTTAKLKNGLHDGTIEKAGLSGEFTRISLAIRTDQNEQFRIDFEISSDNYAVQQANKGQFDRLLKITGVHRPTDTKELIGKRVGVRINRSQFCQFESPLHREVAE
jgi:hypothetical protein